MYKIEDLHFFGLLMKFDLFYSKNSFAYRNVIVFDDYIKISHKKSYADQHHCQGLTYPYQVCISDFPS